MNSRRLATTLLSVAVCLFTGADVQSGEPPTYIPLLIAAQPDWFPSRLIAGGTMTAFT
jgi:hypothetical protein